MFLALLIYLSLITIIILLDSIILYINYYYIFLFENDEFVKLIFLTFFKVLVYFSPQPAEAGLVEN